MDERVHTLCKSNFDQRHKYANIVCIVVFWSFGTGQFHFFLALLPDILIIYPVNPTPDLTLDFKL